MLSLSSSLVNSSPLPHILLPILCFLSLYLPPAFPSRRILFTTLILVNIAINSQSTFPADDRQMRYALAGSWIWVFPVIAKLVLLRPNPEHHCWRLDRVPHEAEVAIRPLSLEKARWTAALMFATRGTGWSHGSTRVPRGPEKNESRAHFVARQFLFVLLGNTVIEAIALIAARADIPRTWSLAALPRIFGAELLMGATVWGIWLFQYGVVAALGVGLGLSQPKDWPPIFGSLSSVSSVAGFWGSFWHGVLRQPALTFSHYFLQVFGVPKRTPLAHAIHLATAFGFSAIFHVLSLYPISHGLISLSRLCADMGLFFMGQVLAIMVETWVAGWFTIASRTRASRASHQTPLEKTKTEKAREPPTSVQKHPLAWIGYIWTVLWLGLSSWLFVRVYFTLGSTEWTTPLRILETILRALCLL